MRCNLDLNTAKRILARAQTNSDPLVRIPQQAPGFPRLLFLLLQNNHNQIVSYVKME